ncbi:hypothetical protein J2S07_004056 [Robertmurraya andreesenii]|uniref:Uncharacterized protein n=1 Tax=Anoxybacillus andreesenii TaxID=1325932 RepID=A0ABT9V9V1_9BACL|nr:hypothetical protein [Robertmurraya andreesenii]
MALTDIPTVRPSSGTIFLIALPIVIFIFFFTQPKSSDVV